jgi:hypothetical protein
MRLEMVSRWAEIAANVGVILTLIFLASEVRANTLLMERQTIMDRAEVLNTPFFDNPELSRILAQIKSVDGPDLIEAAFVERYGLTYEDAVTWGRHLGLIWAGLEADFALEGRSEALTRRIELLIQAPDQRLIWETEFDRPFSDPEFLAYVEELRR